MSDGKTASDYAEISRRNEKGLGDDRKTRKSQLAMYADSAHFVFELLQNADDKGATEIHFAVTDDALVVEHNGKLFDGNDVRSISYFGEGNTDRTKIGHFGLGFKSVFAYTASPRIHSGPESFVIRDLYALEDAPYPDDLPHGRTRFVLPFDHLMVEPNYIERRDWKSATAAREEITTKLARLGAETLLFTEALAEIRWESGDDRGHYLREDAPVAPSVREIYLLDQEGKDLGYLVFSRAIEWPDEDEDLMPQRRRPVEIAFRIDRRRTDGGRIIPLQPTPISVFFPTEKKAGVGFILQGPYRTTPARDNIPPDDTFNRHLVTTSADLLIEALRWLRDDGLLTLDALTTLPLGDPIRGFEPLHDAVRSAILNEALLPASGGGHVAAAHAKLARGAELVALVAPEQLSCLFGSPNLQWIDPALTEDRYGVLHSFLAGKKSTYGWPPPTPALVKDIEVEAGDIARRIDEAFMATQSDEWVIRLYGYLSERSASDFRRRPIIRLANGAHVPPFSNDNVANAFLPIEEGEPELLGDLPFIHAPLVRDPLARRFLEDVLHLTTPDICDVVMKNVLPRFPPEAKLSTVEWRQHFLRVRAALRAPESAKQGELKRALRSRMFLLAEKVGTPEARFFVRPDTAYFDNEETRTFFAAGSGYLLASGEYEEADAPVLRELGVQDRPRVACTQPDVHGHVILDAAYGNHRRGLNGFDPEWTIEGLEGAVKSGSLDLARLLWRYLLPLADSQLIRGKVEYSSEQFYRRPRLEQLDAPAGRLLREHAWLPDKEGSLRRPTDTGLDDLPDDFEKSSDRARKLARQLGMALPHQDQVLDALFAGDAEKRQVLDRLITASPQLVAKLHKLLAAETAPPPEPPGTFRDGLRSMSRRQREGPTPHEESAGTVRNPGRYADKLEEEVGEAIRAAEAAPARVRMQIVREAPSNAAARAFLYEQYEGRCQISGATFRKADGTNFFEAVSLVSRLNADHLNHPGNMLCLSAEAAAKVMFGAFEWIDDLDATISGFRAAVDGGALTDRQARVRIVGEEHLVTWTEQHFLRLVTLWKLA